MRRTPWAGALLACASPLLAEAPTYDGFDHTVGDRLGKYEAYPGKTAPTGQTWVAGGIFGTNSTLDATIYADNLCNPGLAASAGNGVRLLGVLAATGVVDRIAIGDRTPEGNPQVFTTGEVYYSLVLRVAALTDPGDPTSIALNGAFIAGFNNRNPDDVNAPGTTSAGTRLHVCLHNTDNTKFRIGLRPNATSTPLIFDPTPRTPGPDSDPVFIVGRYQFVDGATNNDLQSLWVDPPPESFGAAAAPSYTVTLPDSTQVNFPLTATGADIGPATDNTSGPPAIYCFFLRQNDVAANSTIVDEVRVGLSWADVTPPGPIVLGPCCAADGSCSETTQCACSGTWEHSGLTCADVQCPPPVGPCCAANGTCTETTQADCTGTWDHPGLTCADVSCPCVDPVFDSDGDGDVDLDDFGALQRCWALPATTVGCYCFDKDASGTIDAPDFAAFVQCGTRDGIPANPACDD